MTNIPKIVHQIWIGPNRRPDMWMDTVRKFSSDFGYEYKLWSELEIDSFPMVNRIQYDNMQIMCGKADIVRYEILNMYGGIYIDADSVIINPKKLDELISNIHTECAVAHSSDKNFIANGVILSVPQSFMMMESIKRLPSRNFSVHPCFSTGPDLITDIWNDNKDISITIFPHEVFYPGGWHITRSLNQHEKMSFPEESVMFQYGYTTNYFQKTINDLYNPKPNITKIVRNKFSM